MGAYAECTKGCVDSHGYTLSVLSGCVDSRVCALSVQCQV